MSKPRIIVILGTTGSGKTKLSVELAKCLGGEVINADCLQVYEGLDTITNKATECEMQGVPHHLMSFKSPRSEYSVIEYQQDFKRVVDDIHSRGKIPILVGGTHYYMQSVLFESSLLELDISQQVLARELSGNSSLNKGDCTVDQEAVAKYSESLKSILKRSETYVELSRHDKRLLEDDSWELLSEIDWKMAQRWPRQDFRKVKRALEIFYSTGKTQSEWLQLQSEQKASKQSTAKFQMCVFWLFSDLSVLDDRLDRRVDAMVNNGLVEELDMLSKTTDYTRGIYQAIGYKEFQPFFVDPSKSVFDRCLEHMKQVTRKYARTQLKWIRNKFIPLCLDGSSQECRVYVLDSSSADNWNSNVSKPASTVASHFAKGDVELLSRNPLTHATCNIKASVESVFNQTSTKNEWVKFKCEHCLDSETKKPKEFTGSLVWQSHILSRRHKKRASYKPNFNLKVSSIEA